MTKAHAPNAADMQFTDRNLRSGGKPMIQHLYVPVTKPEDIIPHLAKKERHWKANYSAKELALSWTQAANRIPASVLSVIESCDEFSSTELISGVFESEVDLRTPGRNSQTDLSLLVAWGNQLGVIAVEGKVDEPFGDLVINWNDGSPGKERRLSGLCATLGLSCESVGNLRYQLLHRTASAVYEAQRYRCHRAIMLVHSFSPQRLWFEDFARFSDAMNMSVMTPNTISSPRQCEGVTLRLAWVSDRMSASVAAAG